MLTTRSTKGAALSHAEMDANWQFLAYRTLNYFNLTDPAYNPPADKADGDWSVALKAAMQAAIDAGGGVVFVPLKAESYKISCPYVQLLNGMNPNCQIPFPYVAKDEFLPTLTILGEHSPSFATEGTAHHPRVVNGCIFESTVVGSGSMPSVFGTATADQGVTGERNYLKVRMFNITVRTRTQNGTTNIAGTTTAINASRLIQFGGDQISVDISSTLTDMLEPGNTIGIYMPEFSNKVEMDLGYICLEGYGEGIRLGEHTCIQKILALGCRKAIVAGNGYGCSIQQVDLELNQTNVYTDASGDISIFQYNTEHYTGVEGERWYNYLADVRTNSTGAIRIFNSAVRRSGGGVHVFSSDTQTTYSVLYGNGANSLPEDKERFDAENALSHYFQNTEFNSPSVADYDIGFLAKNRITMSGNGKAVVVNGDGTLGNSSITQRTHGLVQGVGTIIRVFIDSITGSADLINDAGQVLATWTTPGLKEITVGAAKHNPIYGLICTGDMVFDYFRPQKN